MSPKVPIKRLVIDALEIIERIYGAADQKRQATGPRRGCARQRYAVVDQLHGEMNRKLTESLFKVVWEMSVQRHYPVVLMSRRFEPSMLLMSVLCASSGILPRDLFRGLVREESFPMLHQNSVRILNAPIHVWVTPHATRFRATLPAAQSNACHVLILCDWCLKNAELDEAVTRSALGDVTFMDANGLVV